MDNTPSSKRERAIRAINRIGAALHPYGVDVVAVLEKLADKAEQAPKKIISALKFL